MAPIEISFSQETLKAIEKILEDKKKWSWIKVGQNISIGLFLLMVVYVAAFLLGFCEFKRKAKSTRAENQRWSVEIQSNQIFMTDDIYLPL